MITASFYNESNQRDKPVICTLAEYMKKAAILIMLFPPMVSANDMWLGEWLRINDPIVKEYLLGLPESKIGKSIEGVSLSDGKTILEESVYLENKSNKKKGHYIYKFKSFYAGVAYENHYIWSMPGYKSIEIPSCKGEWLVPGGYAVLSGDVYTYSSVQPTGQLVVTHCRLSANQ